MTMESISLITRFIRSCYPWLGQCEPQQIEARKPWIRFERKHSLSMVHLDWNTSIHDAKKVYVCAVLDDSSRRILAGGEFDAETTNNALQLLKEAIDGFGWLNKY